MKKTIFMAAAAAIAMTASGGLASAATPLASHKSETGKINPAIGHDPKATVLYDQSANSSTIGIVSQIFETSLSTYDSQVADDFTVPKGKTWTVTEVEVYGQYFNGSGPATSENVYIYKAGKKKTKGLPGTLVMEYDTLKGKDNAGTFTIKLPKKGLVLTAGTYFISVAANLAFSAGGEWGWYTTTAGGTTYGSPADWENPGAGFGIGCTTYTVETTCIPDGQGSDHVFTILGSSK